MINGLIILDSNCKSIVTQYYKHTDCIDENINKFKSQINQRSDNTDCVLLINDQSFIFLKYNDIIICSITNSNANVFNVLSFQYKLIEIFEEYNCGNSSTNAMNRRYST